MTETINAPVIHVMPLGNMANRMIQFMVVQTIAAKVPGCRLSNVSLPEWGISHPPLEREEGPVLRVEESRLDIDDLAELLRSRSVHWLDFAAYGQRVGQFLDVEKYRTLFDGSDQSCKGGDDDTLVISIRGGDILDGHHPNYVLLPIAFYKECVASVKQKPLFFGQLGDNAYVRQLRAAFPTATFIQGRDPKHDFEFLRRSRHLLISVSTFSWLASWLSYAASITIPLSGFLNPFQDRETDLLDLSDARCRYYLFPINFSVPVARFKEAHCGIDGRWREVSASMLSAMRSHTPRFWPNEAKWSEAFDEAYYQALYPDISAAIQSGALSSGWDHFRRNGQRECRLGFSFDSAWYSRRYPVAAAEVGNGDFETLAAHYVEVGRARGYLPEPPSDELCDKDDESSAWDATGTIRSVAPEAPLQKEDSIDQLAIVTAAERAIWSQDYLTLRALPDMPSTGWAGSVQAELKTYGIEPPLTWPTQLQPAYLSIVVVMLVKDEADIIGANLEWLYFVGVRRIIICNNESSDGTQEVIECFKNKHTDTEVITILDPIIRYVQSLKTTAMLRWAATVWPDSRWVFPVDADEFLIPMQGLAVLDSVEPMARAISIPKVVHFRHRLGSEPDVSTPMARMALRSKLFLVPPKTACRARLDLSIAQGNHSIRDQGGHHTRYSGGFSYGFYYREFQTRSFEHFRTKILNGGRAIQAAQDYVGGSVGGEHWLERYHLLETKGDDALRALYEVECVRELHPHFIMDPFYGCPPTSGSATPRK